MSKPKLKSITESNRVFYTPIQDDKHALAAIEKFKMNEACTTDCTQISDSGILRYCVHHTYKCLKKAGKVS